MKKEKKYETNVDKWRMIEIERHSSQLIRKRKKKKEKHFKQSTYVDQEKSSVVDLPCFFFRQVSFVSIFHQIIKLNSICYRFLASCQQA